MRAVIAKLISTLSLTACASVQAKTPLHELSADVAPKWKMVSLNGLNDYLREIYQTGETKPLYKDAIISPIHVENISFDEFSKTRVTLSLHKLMDTQALHDVYVGFSSCNAIMGNFEHVGGKLEYRSYGATEKGCWNLVADKKGESIGVKTPMLVDEFIKSVLPKITDYRVSKDSKMLNLLDSKGEVLGVFARKEAAE